MSSQVLYRKWRPRTFAELVGQPHINQTLLNALAMGRVAHAYLFCGPRGTGKTSSGRLLAMAVNCLTNGRGEPCGVCATCQAAIEGRAIDLIEIDAASNRGIDDIRNLRERVGFAPNQSRYKVYIVDEVHQLTPQAFDALLKTLEEPPPHAIFILATTAIHRVPMTIASRCQRFDFRRLPLGAVVERLTQVCAGEGIVAEPGVLEAIAKVATGSLRDAENLLEQLLISYGPRLSLEPVRAHLGLVADERVPQLASCILRQDLSAGIGLLGQVAEDGADVQQFQRHLLDYLRLALLVKAGSNANLDLSDEAVDELKALSAGAEMDDILRALRLFGQADFRGAGQPLLPLELALVECCLPKTEAEAPAAPPPARPTATTTPPVAPPPRREAPPPTNNRPYDRAPVIADPSRRATPPPPPSAPTNPAAYRTPPPPPHPDEAIEANVPSLISHWRQVLETCRGASKTVEALLRSSCRPIAIEDNTVVLGFRFQIHKDKLEEPRNRRAAEDVLSQVLGASYQVRCVLAPQLDGRRSTPLDSPLVRAATQMGASIVDEDEEE